MSGYKPFRCLQRGFEYDEPASADFEMVEVVRP